MFAGMDEVGWASMKHAYGSAEDVPELLRGLASSCAQERERALDGMYGAVHHQGDVYDSTLACVPFLFELVGHSELPDRGGIVELLVSIGGGDAFDDGPLEGVDGAEGNYAMALTAIRAGAAGRSSPTRPSRRTGGSGVAAWSVPYGRRGRVGTRNRSTPSGGVPRPTRWQPRCGGRRNRPMTGTPVVTCSFSPGRAPSRGSSWTAVPPCASWRRTSVPNSPTPRISGFSLGRLRPADPDAYARAWLASSAYTAAATASLLTAAWAPEGDDGTA